MVYKKFYFGLIIRLVVFGLLCVIIGILGINPRYIHTFILLCLLILLAVFELVYYLNYTNRYLSNYFNSMYESGAFINSKLHDNTKSFKALSQSMEKVWKLLSEARLQQEEEREFLQTLTKHIGTGIIAFNEDGKVRFCNPVAKKIFGLQHLVHWDQLGEINKDLLEKIQQTVAVNKIFSKCVVQEEVRELLFYISVFKLRNKLIRLISIQDIHEEINKKEVLAWQQMIQVMAHEIMSTISPITSLSKHLYNKLNEEDGTERTAEINKKILSDLIEGLGIINSRGEGLSEFIMKYQSIAYLPEPHFEQTDLNELIKSVLLLTQVEFNKNELVFEPGNVRKTRIDKNLIEQVLLNLIRNSVQALEGFENKMIYLKTYEYTNSICIEIFDEGKGIADEFMDKIFVPFFSTKKKGTGIGLSFTRQVMHLHGGEIKVFSSHEKWTRVKLFFPNNN